MQRITPRHTALSAQQPQHEAQSRPPSEYIFEVNIRCKVVEIWDVTVCRTTASGDKKEILVVQVVVYIEENQEQFVLQCDVTERNCGILKTCCIFPSRRGYCPVRCRRL